MLQVERSAGWNENILAKGSPGTGLGTIAVERASINETVDFSTIKYLLEDNNQAILQWTEITGLIDLVT